MQNNNQTNVILPGKTIGIIGGGQLGRMVAIAAKYMGYQIVVLDPTKNCPTAQVADEQLVAKYDDMKAIKKLTNMCDVITYEFENVDLNAASYIEKKGKLPQGSYALEITQNRQKEKELIKRLNLPVPQFAVVHNGHECERALADFPLPAVIKTCRGGYDGKGQFKIHAESDFKEAKDFADEHGFCIIEQWISFDKEISTIFTRSRTGEITIFPIAENNHKDHILSETIVPARISKSVEQKVVEATSMIAEEMNIVGTFAIEIFVKGDHIYINEMAPRPHNSGHYTIEACNISQFAQHIRAICNLPLIDIELRSPALMKNILGEDLDLTFRMLKTSSNGFVHLYGKEKPADKRKMGHVTFIAKDIHELLKQKSAWE